MRNFKRFLSLVLACLMLIGSSVMTVGAKNGADYTEAANNLAAIGILKGDGNGDLMLDKSVTRYQAALFFVQAITGKTDPSIWNADKSAIFSDVPEYGTAIDYLAGLGLIIGRGNGIYGYNDPVTYQDMLTIAVRALGYETEDMVYPYGHISAAQKLGLTDNIESVSFKDALPRGATAQLIWDFLSTEIAIEDPISGDIIYPGKEDESAYGILLGPGKIIRETYLEKAGFALGKLTFVIKEFTEAEDKDSVDTLTVEYGSAEHVIRASDLGIDKNTPKIEYLGLPVTVYVNAKAEEFFEKYDTDEDESEARIVLVSADSLSDVENIGDAANIRVYQGYLALGGVKYHLDKYALSVYTFGDKGWSESDADEFKAAFAYSDKEGYVGTNSNGAVRYTVRETVEDGKTVKTLHIYYMPYSFGQYFERELKDSTTGKKADFVTIGSYETAKVENLDGELSSFVEYLIGTSSKVTSSTTSVSKRNGEKAKSVTLVGKGIKSGDFMYYYYNSLDNMLTVAENHGSFRYGQLTGTSSSKETVKISGVTFGVGFDGAIDAPWSTYGANAALIDAAIKSYESGSDNIKYVLAGGKVVYMDTYKGESGEGHDSFAVVSLDGSLIASLLGISESKLKYTSGLVLDEEGRVLAAMLEENGRWSLYGIEKMHASYDADEGEYTLSGDLGEYAKYVDIAGDAFSKYEEFETLKNALGKGGVFTLVDKNDGVIELGTAEGALEHGVTDEGLIFSDVASKTNKLSATASGEAQRITLGDGTVTVIVDGEGNVGVRHGVQKAKHSVLGKAKVYAASGKLIVMEFESPAFEGGYTDVTEWGESSGKVTDETYFVALGDSEVTVESSGEDVAEKYTVTVTNLFDLRTLTVVPERVFNTNTVTSIDLTKALYADENGVITHSGKSIAEAFKAARLLEAAKDGISLVEIAPENLEFIDGDTVKVNGGALSLPSVLAGIEATVVTVDASGLDRDVYDFDRLALNVEFDGENGLGGNEIEIADGVYGYGYPLYGDTVEVIGEPTEGVLDGFILGANGLELLLPLADRDDYVGAKTLTTTLEILAHYDSDTGILTMFVAKIIK